MVGEERPVKVAIVGSRNFRHLELVRQFVRGLPVGTEVVSGGARGVDSTTDGVARSVGLPVKTFVPNYQRYQGKFAPLQRNAEIVAYLIPDGRLVAFWDGQSTGTRDVVRKAFKAGIPVTLYDEAGAERPLQDLLG